MARAGAVLPVRHLLHRRAGHLPCPRQLPEQRGSDHPPELRRSRHAEHRQRLPDHHRGQPRDGRRGRHLWIPAGLRRHPRRPASRPARCPHDLQRRGLELRRRAARPGHGLPADQRIDPPRAPLDRQSDRRRRAAQPWPRLRHGHGHGCHHGHLHRDLYPPPAACGALATMKRRRGSIAWWLVFLLGVLYFFLPLVATPDFSLQAKPPFAAYTSSLQDPKFLGSLLYSLVIAGVTITASLALIVPTAYWVQLRVPRARSLVEFVTLLPFVIPAVVLVFGLIRVYSRPPLPFTHTDIGSSALLVAGYIVLSLPYMYRAVDTGLRSIDIRSLTEPAQSMGAGWLTILWRVILPNLRVALLSGAFLTLAIVLGEFT